MEIEDINKKLKDFCEGSISFSATFDPKTTAKVQDFYKSKNTKIETMLEDNVLLQTINLGETINIILPNKTIPTMVVQKKKDRFVLEIY